MDGIFNQGFMMALITKNNMVTKIMKINVKKPPPFNE
jgi:hypothetical protein